MMDWSDIPFKDHSLVPHSERLIAAVIKNYIDNMRLPEPPQKDGFVHRVFDGLAHQPGVVRLQCYARCGERRYEKGEVCFPVDELSLALINKAAFDMNASDWIEIPTGGHQ
jgi:hypothetical protein